MKAKTHRRRPFYAPFSEFPIPTADMIGEVGFIFYRDERGKMKATCPYRLHERDALWTNVPLCEQLKRQRFIRRFVSACGRLARKMAREEKEARKAVKKNANNNKH